MWKNITFKWLSIVARFLAWYSENRLNNYWSHRPRSSRTSHSIDKPLFIRWWPGLFVFTIWSATELKKNIWRRAHIWTPPPQYLYHGYALGFNQKRPSGFIRGLGCVCWEEGCAGRKGGRCRADVIAEPVNTVKKCSVFCSGLRGALRNPCVFF